MKKEEKDMQSSSKIQENTQRYFATSVGLITTKSQRHGANIMAAEWTMQIAHDPMLVAIFIHDSPTYWNIKQTRVFGVNMAADDHSELVNIAGGYSGTEINKLSIPGLFQNYKAVYIDVPMIQNCTLNAECKVISVHRIADHIMVIGKVITAKYDQNKYPLIYTRGNYRKISRKKMDSKRKKVTIRPNQLFEFKKILGSQFSLKAAVAVIRYNNKILLTRDNGFDNYWRLPITYVGKGFSYRAALEKYLSILRLKAGVGAILRIERLTLISPNYFPLSDRNNNHNNLGTNKEITKRQDLTLRANFIIFDSVVRESLAEEKNVEENENDSEEEGKITAVSTRWFDKIPRNTMLRLLIPKDFSSRGPILPVLLRNNLDDQN